MKRIGYNMIRKPQRFLSIAWNNISKMSTLAAPDSPNHLINDLEVTLKEMMLLFIYYIQTQIIYVNLSLLLHRSIE